MPSLLSVRFERSCSFIKNSLCSLKEGRVTSADNDGEHALLCDARKVKMTLKPKVWATPTFERTSLAQQSFQHLAVPRHSPDLGFTSKR
jgi:hypothetical protein